MFCWGKKKGYYRAKQKFCLSPKNKDQKFYKDCFDSPVPLFFLKNKGTFNYLQLLPKKEYAVTNMEQIIPLLEHYKYLILIPLAIIEGPMIMVIAGFLVALGLLNAFWVYVIIVMGDVIGDSLAYGVGRWGGPTLQRLGVRMGATPDKVVRAREFFRTHHQKAIIMSKLIHGVGIAGLVTAGALKIPYGRYLRSCLMVSIPQAGILLVVGVLFGHAYIQIEKYLNGFAAIASVAVLTAGLLFALYKFKFKRI